ncbi:SUKH-4 family immunity protein [Nocardioides sp.]|uniref:SUKH-4 family immunity protein n=1 Tax=Nocardioides sp. TaxID=35761 RepID=UPI002C60082D|nr:SUKH-4 family immunity protein [Nocardioides sp.]HVX53325.1 SUKH-4 family immunity protein [Nocardioides sp.]
MTQPEPPQTDPSQTEPSPLVRLARRLCGQVRDRALLVPYPGRWTAPGQLDDTHLRLAEDGDVSRLFIDHAGAVVLVDGSGRHRVNSSLEAFAESVHAYTEVMREVAGRGFDDGDHDDQLEEIEHDLLQRLATIDTALSGGPDGFWVVAAEEIGLGTAPFPRTVSPAGSRATEPASPTENAADADRVLVALTDADRDRLFTQQQWKRLTALAPVTLVRAPHMIETAVDVARQTDAARGNPTRQPTVLVTTDAATLTPALWAKLPVLRLVCLLASSAPDHEAPAGVRVSVLAPSTDGDAVVDEIARGLAT